jgi:hypothetical protein
MGEARNNQKFLDKILDPQSMKESVAFNATMSGLQLLGLLAMSFLGATVGFGFKDWLTTVTSYDYWVSFVVMTAEQFYAYSVGYRFTLSLMLTTEKYSEAIQQSVDILEGVYSENPDGTFKEWIRKPLKEDSAIIDIVADEMNLEERERLFRIAIQDVVSKLASKKNDLEAAKEILEKKKPAKIIRWAVMWILKLRMKKLDRKIDKINRRVTFLKAKQIDKEYLESLPDRKIPGYVPIDTAALHSAQEDELDDKAIKSKWGMRSQKEYEKKGAFKRALFRVIGGILMPLVAWGVVALKGGAVLAMIVMIIMQLRSGWSGATKTFKVVVLYNASQQFKILKEIQFRIPAVKKRLDEKKRLAEEKAKLEEEKRKAFALELAKGSAKLLTGSPVVKKQTPVPGIGNHEDDSRESNTTDILPQLHLNKSTP